MRVSFPWVNFSSGKISRRNFLKRNFLEGGEYPCGNYLVKFPGRDSFGSGREFSRGGSFYFLT